METIICVGLILILTEFREWRFQKKVSNVFRQLKVIHRQSVKAHAEIEALKLELNAKANEESVLALVSQAEFQAENMRKLLKETESIEKYRSQQVGYDIIEGGI